MPARSFKTENIPFKPPVLGTASWITIAHYWGAPEWLWGILGLCLVLAWLMYFHWLATHQVIEVAAKKEDGDRD